MSKMTPGPWATYRQGNHIAIGRDRAHLVAVVSLDKYLPEQDVANAKAIAALPALIKALEQIALYSRVNHDKPKDYGEVANDALKQAGVLE